MPRPEAGQIARYGTVGLSNTVVSAAAYAALTTLGGAPVMSSSTAFLIGAANGYFWNRHWTFASADRASLPRYLVVQAAGLATTDLFVAALAGTAGRLGAYGVGVSAATLATFAANRRYTFRTSQRPHSRV